MPVGGALSGSRHHCRASRPVLLRLRLLRGIPNRAAYLAEWPKHPKHAWSQLVHSLPLRALFPLFPFFWDMGEGNGRRRRRSPPVNNPFPSCHRNGAGKGRRRASIVSPIPKRCSVPLRRSPHGASSISTSAPQSATDCNRSAAVAVNTLSDVAEKSDTQTCRITARNGDQADARHPGSVGPVSPCGVRDREEWFPHVGRSVNDARRHLRYATKLCHVGFGPVRGPFSELAPDGFSIADSVWLDALTVLAPAHVDDDRTLKDRVGKISEARHRDWSEEENSWVVMFAPSPTTRSMGLPLRWPAFTRPEISWDLSARGRSRCLPRRIEVSGVVGRWHERQRLESCRSYRGRRGPCTRSLLGTAVFPDPFSGDRTASLGVESKASIP